MSEEKVLTKVIAEQFLEKPASVDMGSFEKWEEDAIYFLLESIQELEDEDAQEVVRSGICKLTKGVLTGDIAYLCRNAFCDDCGRFDFNDFTFIEDEAAKELAGQMDQSNYDLEIHLYLNGLTSLSEAAAKYLSQIRLSGWLELDGLTEVNEETASHLSNTTAFLSLAGVEALSDEAAMHLSQVRGLGLTLGLTSISDQAAEHLSSVIGGLRLNGIEELSDQAAESLSQLEGETPRLDPLGQPMGEPFKASLELNGLEQLSDAAAKSLSKFNGTLELSGLNQLSDAAVAALAEHEFYDASLGDYRGRLNLPSEFKAKVNSLINAKVDGLMAKHDNVLTKEIAEHFVSGQINTLDACISMVDEAAVILAEHTGDIRLEGLTELNDSTAKILESHRGVISFHRERQSLFDKVKAYKALYALKMMDDAHLAEARSNVRLDGLNILTDEVIELLAKVPLCRIHLNGLTELSDQHAEFLFRHEGGLALPEALQAKVDSFKDG